MKTRAAVAFAAGQPLEIAEVDVSRRAPAKCWFASSNRRLPHRRVHPVR